MLTIIRFFINHFNDREFIASRQFLDTEAWHKVRNSARVKNRRQYGKLTCEACGFSDGSALCVDHILPRKHYPRLALFGFNFQMLCDYCNEVKGSEYSDDFRSWWRYPLAVFIVAILR
jgi:5-methylcytosine-specific restriction endonuclease McrA